MNYSNLLDSEIKKFLLQSISKADAKSLKSKIEYIEVTPNKVKQGSKKHIKYKNGVTKSKTLTTEEATLSAKAMSQYFKYKVNAVPYTKSNAKSIFYIENDIIKMSVAKAYISTGTNSCILIASNHKNIRSSLSNFSEFFTRFIKSKREVFLDYEGMDDTVKRNEFSGPRGISNKYVKYLGTVDGRSQISTSMRSEPIDVSVDIIKSSVASKNVLKEYVDKEVKEAEVKYKSRFGLTPFSKILGTLNIEAVLPSWLYDKKKTFKMKNMKGFKLITTPVIDNLVNGIFSIFHIDKAKKKKFASRVKKRTVKSSGKVKPSIRTPTISKTPNFEPDLDITVYATGQDCGVDLKRLLQLKGLLNMNLHDQLSAQMPHGKTIFALTGISTDEDEDLNYVSGRFAHSVEVTNLTIDRNTCELQADFTYMKNPYGIAFEPGGQWHKPSRSPNYIISTAIRTIAIDIMKDRFAINPRLV